MNHFHQIAALLERYDMDAMLLTGEANRFYASGFHSAGTDGVALVTRKKAYYFTDSRYTEAAGRCVQGAEIREVGPGRGYTVLLTEVLGEQQVCRLGFEEAYMTVLEHERYRKALPCDLVPAAELLRQLRTVKDGEELDAMVAAQRIAEKALDVILEEIRPGVTEKEIAARLQYLMLHFGAENMSFDPIVVSGPNGSLPHGVPGERTIQRGEFVTMDFGCIYHGYCSDMTRTFYFRKASDGALCPAGGDCRRPGRGHRTGRGRRCPGSHCRCRVWGVFRPQLRPWCGGGDSRIPQRLSLQ